MVQLIMGLKGSGKTKRLVEMVATAVREESGSVVCIEKDKKLTYDIPYQARLIYACDYAYALGSYDFFKGFLSGLHAGNYDITHLFVDGTFKIGKVGDVEKDYEGFAAMIQKLAKVQSDAQIIFTVSCDEADLPVTVKDYIVK